jgi:peroxiredoxin Q/BCP
MIEPGDAFPDFELANQDGETVRLADYRGRKIVLFAFPRADTPGCTRQACGFRDHFGGLQEAGAVVLGISPDPPATLARWKAKENLPYDLLSDPAHETLERLGAWGEKSMYGRKYQGVLRSHWVIDGEGKLLDAQVKVSPAQSVESAVRFLAA